MMDWTIVGYIAWSLLAAWVGWFGHMIYLCLRDRNVIVERLNAFVPPRIEPPAECPFAPEVRLESMDHFLARIQHHLEQEWSE